MRFLMVTPAEHPIHSTVLKMDPNVLGGNSMSLISGLYRGFHLLTQATPTLGLKHLHAFSFDSVCEDSSHVIQPP